MLTFSMLGILILGAFGAWMYALQRDRNTQKLKARAQEATSRSDLTEAASCYRQYLNRRADDVEALAAYADVLVALTKEKPEQLGNTIRVLQRLVRVQPANVKAVKELVGAYLLIAEHTLGEDMASTWVSLSPDSAEAVVALAAARRGRGKIESALEALLQGVERMPREASLYPPIIALTTVELNRPEEGRIWLDKALAAVPDSPTVQLAAFAYHNTRKNFGKAEEHLALALTAAPDDPTVLLPGASYYTERGELTKAKELLDRMAAKSPDDQRMLITLASWASRKRDPVVMAETAKRLEQQAGEKHTEVLARAAELYLAAEQPVEADRCIARLEAVVNPPPALQTWLSALRGSRAVMEGRPYGAVVHLEEVIRKEPHDVRTLELLGRAYVDMGALEPAADAYRRLLAQTPDVVVFRLTLARIEMQLGRDAAATGLLSGLTDMTPVQRHQANLLVLAGDLHRAMGAAPSVLQTTDMRERLQRLAGEMPPDEPSARLLSTCLAMVGYPTEMSALVEARMADEATGGVVAEEYVGFLLFGRKYDKAQPIIEALERRSGAAASARRLKVKWLAATSGVNEARQFIDAGKEEDAAKGALFVALAEQCDELGQREAAREAYVVAAGLLPQAIAVRQQVRRLATSRVQALEAVNQIQALEGENGLSWRLERALALLQFSPDAAVVTEAAELLQVCVERRKEWPEAYVALGNAKEMLGEFTDAAQAYQTAINQQPALATAGVALRLVGVFNRLGRFVEADALLGRVVESNPRSPDALAMAVEKHVRDKDVVAASAAAVQLLTVKADDPAVAALAADLMLQKGDIARSEEIAVQGMEKHPDATAVQWSLVRVRLAQQRSDEARKLARQIAERRKTAKDYWFLGQVFEQLGEAAEAEGAISLAMEIAPQDAQLLAGISEFWRMRGERTKQLDMARRAVAVRADDPQAALALAEVLAGSQFSPAERREAEDIVAARLQAAPDDPRALALDAFLAGLRETPDLDHARKQLDKALALNPRLPKGYQLLAAVQIRRGDMKAAQEAVAAGLALNPDEVELLLVGAEIAGYRGEYEQAMLSLRRVFERRPRHPPALRLLPSAAERAGQIDRAIKLVEAGAADGKLNAEESVALGSLYEAKKDLPQAELLFQQSIALSPEDSSVFQTWLQFQSRRNAYGRVRDLAEKRKAERPDDVGSLLAAAQILGLQSADAKLREVGIEWLMAIASAHPAFAADAIYRAGVCHLQGGDVAQAESAFLQAAQAAPTSPGPVNDLAWLYSEELDRPADASAILQKFLSAGGRETPQMLDTHGAVLLRLGQWEAARTKLLACIDAAGQTETLTAATFHLGQLLHHQQKHSDAVAHLRRALDLDKRYGGLSEKDRAVIGQLLAGASGNGAS